MRFLETVIGFRSGGVEQASPELTLDDDVGPTGDHAFQLDASLVRWRRPHVLRVGVFGGFLLLLLVFRGGRIEGCGQQQGRQDDDRESRAAVRHRQVFLSSSGLLTAHLFA